MTAPDDAVRAFWCEINEIRRERGLSYRQLERRVRIPDSTLQYWMTRSRRLVPWLQVRKLILALGEQEMMWFARWKQTDRQVVSGAAAEIASRRERQFAEFERVMIM